MEKIPQKDKERLREFAHAFVASMVNDTENPIYRGENFKWHRFPDVVGRLVAVSVFTHFPNESFYYKNGEFRKDYKGFARKEAIKMAEKIIAEKKLV
jgi:hypothetical protein